MSYYSLVVPQHCGWLEPKPVFVCAVVGIDACEKTHACAPRGSVQCLCTVCVRALDGHCHGLDGVRLRDPKMIPILRREVA